MAKHNPFTAVAHGDRLAEAIVDAIREPLLVLDPDFRVIAASRSFYRTFAVTPRKTEGRLVFALGDGQWNIPGLRALLEDIIPKRRTVEAYEVEHEFPSIGLRVMLLNAGRVFDEDGSAFATHCQGWRWLGLARRQQCLHLAQSGHPTGADECPFSYSATLWLFELQGWPGPVVGVKTHLSSWRGPSLSSLESAGTRWPRQHH